MPEVCGWTHNGGQAFIYMELVQGYTLEKQWDNLDPTGRVDICEQLSTLIAELRKLRHAPGEFFLGIYPHGSLRQSRCFHSHFNRTH